MKERFLVAFQEFRSQILSRALCGLPSKLNLGISQQSCTAPASRNQRSGLCHAVIAALALAILAAPGAQAASKARIVVPDALCLAGEEVWVEAYLYREGLVGFFRPEVQGEVLRFADEHQILKASRLTDATGMARIRFQGRGKGHFVMRVSISENPRYAAEPATGSIFVREKDPALFFVLVEGAIVPAQPVSLLPISVEKAEPVSGSVERLRQIAVCATLVYLTQLPVSRWQQMRRWLDERECPPGALLTISGAAPALPVGSAPGLGKLEALKERDLPACLVTTNSSLSASAAKKGVQVYLLEEAGGESESGKVETEKGVKRVRGWDQIPPGCTGCRKGKANR